MKKLFSVLMALCLILTTAALAEEGAEKTYADEHPGVLAFDSYWVSGDAKIRIDAMHADDRYEIVVVEMTGENTFNSWEYLLDYDEETKALVADGNGMKSANVFDEKGTITSSEYEYEDGSARFFINDQDQLCWSDEKESTFEATVFIRIGRFPGVYTSDQAKLLVNWAGEDLIYDAWLDMPESASQTWHWSWSGKYNPTANTIELNGERLLYTIIKDTITPNFMNIRTSLRTYDRDALCCGTPCWRWAYHALHSADKWFINPNCYEEPAFHEEGMDNPDNPTSVILTDEQLFAYLDTVEQKTMAYLDTLTDEMLYEKPEGCRFTRLELILRQYRHISFHTGMLNGQTALATGQFPIWVSEASGYVDDGIFFGRYRKGQVKA